MVKRSGGDDPPGGLPRTASYTPADARAWKQAFPAPSVPRGVYRFASHEEADAWLMKMITRVSQELESREPTLADLRRLGQELNRREARYVVIDGFRFTGIALADEEAHAPGERPS